MKIIKLTQGKEAIVDDSIYELIKNNSYFYDKKWGYARRAIRKNGKYINVFLHQEVIEIKLGKYNRKKFLVDHINRNTLDCQSDNLRLVNKSQSSQNRRTFSSKKGSRYTGVYLHKAKSTIKKFEARLFCKPKVYYLGYYATEEEAADVYNMKALEIYGPQAKLNKIDYKDSHASPSPSLSKL